jgi:hypothetical protein
MQVFKDPMWQRECKNLEFGRHLNKALLDNPQKLVPIYKYMSKSQDERGIFCGTFR